MKAEKLSVNRVCIAIGAFLLLLSVSMSLFLYFLTKNTLVLCCGLLYAAGAFGCLTLFLAFIRRKLTLFSDALCKQLDDMMSSDREPPQYAVEETCSIKSSTGFLGSMKCCAKAKAALQKNEQICRN